MAFKAGFAVLVCAGFWAHCSGDFAAVSETGDTRVVISKERLQYSKGDAAKIRLAILGEVFDVTAGRRHYGKDGGYSFFAGRDASRAYVTGEFNEEGLREDVDGLDPSQILGIVEWGDFMRKTYQYEGVTPGLYYDETGAPTQLMLRVREMAEEGRRMRADEKDEQQRLPTCNSKWTQYDGGEVWCSKDSGGVQRNWIGYPRKLFDKKGDTRCACVPKKLLSDPRLKEYENCASTARHCKLPRTNS